MKEQCKQKLLRVRLYVRVYKTLLRLNLAKLFAYRANFYSSALAHTVWAVFTIVAMILLTSRSSSVYGWSRDELLLLAGTYNLIFSIFYFFFSRNFGEFSETVHFGRLDTFLLKPIDSQFLMSIWNAGYTQLIRFTLGVGFITYMLHRMDIVLTIVDVAKFMLLVFVSVGIMYSFWMLIMTLLLWFSNLSNLVSLLYEVNNISKYPQELYRGFGVAFLIVLFPLTLVVTMPAKALLQQLSWTEMLLPIGVVLVMLFAARKFWKFALHFYTSASG